MLIDPRALGCLARQFRCRSTHSSIKDSSPVREEFSLKTRAAHACLSRFLLIQELRFAAHLSDRVPAPAPTPPLIYGVLLSYWVRGHNMTIFRPISPPGQRTTGLLSNWLDSPSITLIYVPLLHKSGAHPNPVDHSFFT